MPLRRSDRLFDIICILLAASRPVTSAVIVNELEVTCAPSSRDVAGSSHPDRGRSGVGYVLRRGYELLPLITDRVIQPFAVAYYVGATLICAWCEVRNVSSVDMCNTWPHCVGPAG